MNTIRELKQQEKYSNMLKKKNKEKNIYKNRNSTLRIEKMNLIKAIERKDKEIERLNNIINEFDKWLNNIPNYFMDRRSNNTGVYIQKGMQQMIDMCKNKLQELKGSDK